MAVKKILDINLILPTLASQEQLSSEFAKVKPMIDAAFQNAEDHKFVTQDAFNRQILKVNLKLDQARDVDDRFDERIAEISYKLKQHSAQLSQMLTKTDISEIQL
jgi:hypothetical protein